MPGLVMAGPALARAVRSEFINTYKNRYRADYGFLAQFAQLEVASDKLQEIYVYPESAPYPVRQPRGDAIESGTFRYRGFEVLNHAFARSVEWFKDDEDDDQTSGSLIRQARSLGNNYASLNERLLFQYLTGASDPDLMPSVPNAPDGAALFSGTDGGGSARFGATSGNLLSGSGVANATQIQTDFFNALEQFGLFKDTENQPLLAPEMLTKFAIVVPMAAYQIFLETFIQQLRFQSVDSSGASGQTSNVVGAAAPSNLLLDAEIGPARSRLDLTIYPSQRLTDASDWYIALTSIDHKALFIQNRSQLEVWNQLPENSDKARTTQVCGVYTRQRKGAGIALPYNMIKINN